MIRRRISGKRIRGLELCQKILELLERTGFAVHVESMAQRIPDPGVNGGRSHLHEASAGAVGDRRSIEILLFHMPLTCVSARRLQPLRTLNGTGPGLLYE